MNKRPLLLLFLFLAAASHAVPNPEPYHRPRWQGGCLNTREKLMVKLCTPLKLSPSGCAIVEATCFDVYSGASVASDTPSATFQADHLYPAVEAWRRRTWTKKEFATFFNDTRNIAITRARTNDRKGNLMPHRWCPASRGARILCAKRFRGIAAAYSLPILPAEEEGLKAWAAGECAKGAKLL